MDACVLHVTRFARDGSCVDWSRFIVYEGACDEVSTVQKCAVYCIMTVLFAMRWSTPEYMREFYFAVLDREYGRALAIPRPAEYTFTLIHAPGAWAVVNNHVDKTPTREQVDAVAQKGLEELRSWMSSKG